MATARRPQKPEELVSRLRCRHRAVRVAVGAFSRLGGSATTSGTPPAGPIQEMAEDGFGVRFEADFLGVVSVTRCAPRRPSSRA
ncbi:hypothetical protein ACFQ3Z_00805 [Streptomyces nogalater]